MGRLLMGSPGPTAQVGTQGLVGWLVSELENFQTIQRIIYATRTMMGIDRRVDISCKHKNFR